MVSEGTVYVSPITVSGIACDSVSTITSVTLDGAPVTLSGSPPCLGFSAQLDSRWGFNIIRGTAKNETGYATNLVQSYLRSPDYFAPAPPATGAAAAGGVADKVPNGLYLQLNQKIIDDGLRAYSDIAELDDLASIVAWQLAAIDLNASIPSPLIPMPGTHSCDCLWPIPDITIHNLGYGVNRGTLGYSTPTVDSIVLVPGGVFMGFTITNFSLPVSVTGYLGDCITSCVDRLDTHATCTGTIYLDGIVMSLQADVSLGPSGRPVVTIPSVNIHLTGLRLDIDWGLLEFLDGPLGLSNMTSSILGIFQAGIEGLLESELQAQIPPVVQEFIEGFEPRSTVTLPPPMNTTLNVASQFDLIDIEAGSARLGIAASISPANPVFASPMGPIRRGGSSVPTFAETPYALGVGLKDDLLNQFLWAAWRGAALEIANLSALGCSVPQGFEASMSAALPPVVMPGTGGYEIDIGFGDVYIEASLPGNAAAAAGGQGASDVALYASTVVGATLEIDPDSDRLVVTLQDDPDIAVQIVRAPKGVEVEVLTAQYTALFECVLSTALQHLIGSYPLPSFPIGLVGLPGVPADAAWVLDDGVVGRHDPYYTVTGDIVVK
jgi:hypothetical protein